MPVIDRTDRILQDVLDRITPTQPEQEKTRQMVDQVVAATKQVIKGKRLDHVIAGSFTRDTWMKDKREFDIFIRFQPSTPRKRLEEQGLDLGKQISSLLNGKHMVAYAEHPYVRIKLRDYDVDVVPCYRVESAMQIQSAVDRTPFHNDWLSRHFLKQFSPDVRLLKQFCKGQSIYGSDTRTMGFSGYLCELLIIQYRTFKNLARKASVWKPGKVIINLEGIYPVTDVRNVHRKFRHQPLVVIDPVDPGRNVAAALSPANFIQFIKSCRDFISKPSTDYFFRKPPAPTISRVDSDITKRRTRLIGFSCPAPRVIEDVLWPQLRRTARRLRDILEDHDFDVHGYDVWSDGRACIFFFELEVGELPRIRKIVGPEIFSLTNSENFVRKYKPLGRVWVDDENWAAEVTREFTTPAELLEKTLSGKETELKKRGIASYLSREISRKKQILGKRDLMARARKSKEFGQYLQDFLEKNMV
jgi:tRNA nucleotidyltransferase (CCA-adding enzyme)